MLNTKYIIDRQEQVIPRPEAFGNAWLLNNIKVVNSLTRRLRVYNK
ncbi:MAG: hypothetical protein IPI77_19440 [Saprospiraceae bacterium]|nr:hypothetical protein [Saprospiraceae bacterium]